MSSCHIINFVFTPTHFKISNMSLIRNMKTCSKFQYDTYPKHENVFVSDLRLPRSDMSTLVLEEWLQNHAITGYVQSESDKSKD